MTNRNFNGIQINQSVTISEVAGATITDCRNRIMTYDANGNVILAENGSAIPIGFALIESGINDMSGKESGKIDEGNDIDIQVKDIGYVLAGESITKGAEIAAGAGGLAVTASTGNYVVGFALNSASTNDYCKVQISKYQKN